MNLPCKKSEVCWIIWRDAYGGERIHRDNISQGGIVINMNVGWIAHEDESRIALAQGISQSGELDVLYIPTENIVEKIFPYKRRK